MNKNLKTMSCLMQDKSLAEGTLTLLQFGTKDKHLIPAFQDWLNDLNYQVEHYYDNNN